MDAIIEHRVVRADLKPLTALRFVAALLVFAYHVPPIAAMAHTYELGPAGVGFFFLLSGFILTYTYHRDFSGGLDPMKMRAFHVARIARILPVYFVTLAGALACCLWIGTPVWNVSSPFTRSAAFAEQALLLQSWARNTEIYNGGNSVGWSISTEAFFYLVFPLVAWLLIRCLYRSTSRTVLLVAVGTWSTFALATLLLPIPEQAWALYVFPPARMLDFVVGMFVALAFVRVKRTLTRATLFEAAALGLAVLAVLGLPRAPEAWRYAIYFMPAWAIVILVFAHQSGAISRILSTRVAVRLGELSFAFYLVHYNVIVVVTRFGGWTHPIVAAAIALSVSLAISAALFFLVEVPARVRIRAALSRRPMLGDDVQLRLQGGEVADVRAGVR